MTLRFTLDQVEREVMDSVVSPHLTRSIVEFSHDLSHLRVPDHSNWTSGPYELPELVAERGFRASHLAFVLASREGLENPERTCSQILFRDLPQVLAKGNPTDLDLSNDVILGNQLSSFSKTWGELGEFLITLWQESVSMNTSHSVVAEDASYLAEAFSLLEQRARGNLSVGERLMEISKMLQTTAGKDLMAEATSISPFRYWQEFSAQNPNLKGLADYIFEIGKLRLESRSGWQYLGIRHESVAAHTFRAAQLGVIMAYLADSLDPNSGPVDPHRVAAEVTMHENGETRVQDANLVAKSYVKYNEASVIDHQTFNLGELRQPITDMWEAVEHRLTPSGAISKDADRLEMVIEAANLVRSGVPAADSWIHNTKPMMGTAIAIHLFEEVESWLKDQKVKI